MAESSPDLSSLPVQPGSVLGGKYLLEGLLGQGAMGVVLAARCLEDGSRVAIKVLLPDALEHNEAVARFEREVRLVRQLSGRHVARVLDAGMHGESPFMAIELLDGHDLAQELHERGPLPPEDAVGWILQALDAVVEAHAQGIVHRDLKPSNLFLARQPDGSRLLKVLDFGISKQHGEGGQGAALTKTHSLIGSPLYMAPEQVLAARDADPRSDLWSLGVVLFELLTGQLPFDGTNVGVVLSNVLSAPIPSARSLRPELPRNLELILRACLARPVDERYPSGVALARDLLSFAPPGHEALLERIAANGAQLPGASWSALASDDSIEHRITLPGAPPDNDTTLRADFPALPGALKSDLHEGTRGSRGPLVALLIVLGLLAAAALAARLTG
ncbi:MAG: serine/threonine protein kinase [Polyangiaceae bacterium]|jgi:serine/threonine-protein kinase|nr:serine/threonine protein kinase [Polyangiaceae bacterium]